MKRSLNILIKAGMVAIMSALLMTATSAAESETISESNVVITNNVIKSDTIVINGLAAREKICVYADETTTRRLATKTAGSNGGKLKISIKQLGVNAGSVFITSTLPGYEESPRIEVEYGAELQSPALPESSIGVENNSDGNDIITVEDLEVGDKIVIYKDSSAAKKLTSAVVGANKSAATLKYTQLGANGGTFAITLTRKGMRESEITVIEFQAEDKSDMLSLSDIEITNVKGSADKIYITNIEPKDKVFVYENLTTATKLATISCPSGKDEVTKTISRLKKDGGKVYVSYKQVGKQESDRLEISYDAEVVTEPLDVSQVTITNNPKGVQDVIEIEGLESGAKVRVFKQENSTAAIKTVTCGVDNDSVEIKIAQIGADEGTLWFDVANANSHASVKIPVLFDGELISEPIDASNVTIINNFGSSDIIRVSELTGGDIIKVYKTAAVKTSMATKTVSDTDIITSISLAQLGVSAGNVYITRTQPDSVESERVAVPFAAEGKSLSPDSENITVKNYMGRASVMKVTGLSEDDTVLAYKNKTDTEPIGTATVPTYYSEVEVSLGSLEAGGGKLYVAVRSKNLQESVRIEVDYGEQAATEVIKESKVTIENNCGIADKIIVTERDPGDVITVYTDEKKTKTLGSATVSQSSIKATISVTQLGEESGSVYISAKSNGLKESDLIEIKFEAEKQTDSILTGNVEIVNNSGKADTVTVYGLMPGNTVKVYNSKDETEALVSADVPSNGASVVMSISQLGTNSGSLFITVTKTGCRESEFVEIDYAAESKAIASADVEIINNATIADKITVTGLASGDIVNVYETASTSSVLTKGTAGASGTVTLTVNQLGTNSGAIYVTVTNKNRAESERVKVDYSEEQSSLPLFIGQVDVSNNTDASDKIIVKGLKPYDTIRVYDLISGGSLLGTASVGTSSDTATVTIKQLSESAGTVYITVTSYGMTESTRLAVAYIAEED